MYQYGDKIEVNIHKNNTQGFAFFPEVACAHRIVAPDGMKVRVYDDYSVNAPLEKEIKPTADGTFELTVGKQYYIGITNNSDYTVNTEIEIDVAAPFVRTDNIGSDVNGNYAVFRLPAESIGTYNFRCQLEDMRISVCAVNLYSEFHSRLAYLESENGSMQFEKKYKIEMYVVLERFADEEVAQSWFMCEFNPSTDLQ